MKPFWTIVKLSCRNAVRSHIFQILFAILVLCVVFIPATIEGDGTARGFIQVSLKFSLFAISLMLSLSAIWSGCMTMTQDIDGYQLHMVVSKPVSRVTVWLAKWTGVFLIHFTLLVIASILVYVVVMARYNAYSVDPEELERVSAQVETLNSQYASMPVSREKDSAKMKLDDARDVQKQLLKQVEEDKRIRNEVLVARRQFMPVGRVTGADGVTRDEPLASPDYFAKKAQSTFNQMMRDDEISGVKLDAGSQRERLKEIKVKAIADESTVKYGVENRKIWRITGLPTREEVPLYLRFRAYVTKVSDFTERDTVGQWFYGRVVPGAEGTTAASTTSWVALSEVPQMYRTNRFIELSLPRKAVDSSGTVYISFINLDPQREDMFFQVWDGPQVFAKEGSFTLNYVKCIFSAAIGLLILSALGCAMAGLFSMPTSIFIVIAYLFTGGLATAVASKGYIITSDPTVALQAEVGATVGKILMLLVIPLQDFDVSGLIADGIMIEWSSVGELFFNFFILRALPFCLLCIWLYRRREMGLVIRK